MTRRRSNEPFFWSLFSGGGMLSALVLPATAFVLWFAIPLGWVTVADYDRLRHLFGQPAFRMGIFALITLSAFHWGHRFRFTLYDGLQLHHLFGLIATVCYGGAALISLLAAWVLWSL